MITRCFCYLSSIGGLRCLLPLVSSEDLYLTSWLEGSGHLNRDGKNILLSETAKER